MFSLELKYLRKSFNRKEVVRGISLEVEKGQLLALLGPSGCGKTTTLRIISGLDIPDGGEIRIGGLIANQGHKAIISQKQRCIGMVFQDLALWPHMTVFENIEFGLKVKKLARTERRKRIAAVLGKLNMEKYTGVYPGKLSGGQQQLVAIARAIITEPKLLLMDEPLSNIDIKLRENIRQEIKRIQKETQITTVYVTHDQEDAFLLANKVAVMNEGSIEQTGSPEEIYSSPQSLFVAGFIGESTILPVKIIDKDRIFTPWGELSCHTNNYETGDGFLFFRPHEVKIADDGRFNGVITNRNFIGEWYSYHISTPAGGEIKSYSQALYEVGQSVKFSIMKMAVFPQEKLLPPA
jgi:ABC-type Fe3+/spermidine/putrescine transport system ATPase subunit